MHTRRLVEFPAFAKAPDAKVAPFPRVTVALGRDKMEKDEKSVSAEADLGVE
jgi:hypothetical protein